MAIQILPKEESLAERLGIGLGGGLGSGLQQLVTQNLEQMLRQKEQQHTRTGLESLGFAPEQAAGLSGLEPSILREIVKQQQKAPQEQAFASALQSLFGEPSMPSAIKQQTGVDVSPEITDQPSSPRANVQLPQAFPENVAPRLSSDQALKLAQLGIQRDQMMHKKNIEAFKMTKDERKEIVNKARAARNNMEDLERIEELNQEGKLDTPGYVEFLKRSGLDIPALMNPQSEEFQKIVGNFIRDAKSYFGARVSNLELEQFARILPNLSQSPEGRKRVIANLKRINRVSQEYYKAMKKVIDDNKGVPPLDLTERIEDEIDNRLSRIANQFKEDLQKSVPPGQEKYITGLQAAVGSLVGPTASAIGKAFTGGGALGIAKLVSGL